ncbi:hypothetical protein BaRGS_00032911 [Batillaria attramentaria]|uniref:Uncharacterized protein n=1 Tax=Batillaria attramentaria TaxID=370345 RepID=A0ABD0JME8_9CAEN
MEEVAQIPKLKALLARRDMEIQRLETRNERLMEEVGHQSFNNSGLSSSFSETPRRSVMLAEREAEVWHLNGEDGETGAESGGLTARELSPGGPRH